jgi:hypothetical protein
MMKSVPQERGKVKTIEKVGAKFVKVAVEQAIRE